MGQLGAGQLGAWTRACRLALFCVVVGGLAPQAVAQVGHRTRNFIVQAPTQQLARSVGEAAERYRRELAVYWLGSELPPWPAPCPVRVVTGPSLPAQGVTTYQVSPVRDFQMEVVGTPTRILDSVLPHEVTHTILATHFGQPLPRWADEGVCTTVEHDAEKRKHRAKLREFLTSNRGIPMNKLFLLREYPQDVLPMYAQGYSVCQFLIAQQGPRAFIDFIEAYMGRSSWTATVREHYGYESLAELQEYWLAWVQDGERGVDRFVKQAASPTDEALASNGASSPTSPTPPATRLAALGDATRGAIATASATEDADGEGWYLRRRQQAASRAQIDPPAPAAPPRSYSAAQPQPEQPIGSGAPQAPRRSQPRQRPGATPWPQPTSRTAAPVSGGYPVRATKWR